MGVVLIILAVIVTFFAPSSLPLSPLGPPTTLSTVKPKPSFIVLGFAPYWNLKKLSPESLSTITHFAYFNLHLSADGGLYTKLNQKEEDPGYTNYKRLRSGAINYQDKPLILTFMPESQSALSAILSSPSARQKAIMTIVQTLTDSGALGINIDFEPLGDTPPSLRDNFTLFIKDLRSQLSINHQSLSISVYASAAVRPRIWDLAALSQHTDYFVIMTYDYTTPGSSSAGPTAPLRGSGEFFEHDVVKNIAELTKIVDSRKLLLGIPFYGYEWDTLDESKYSPVESRGSVASLERIQKMLDEQTLSLLWDRNTLTPYGVSTQSGRTSQIYFENETSIRLKLDFVKSTGLGGIAIWALGYEGNTPWLWPTISSLSK